MSLVQLNCPGCGAPLELDDSKLFGFCVYCGGKVFIENASLTAELEVAKRINQSSDNEVVSIFKEATDSRSPLTYQSYNYNRDTVCDAI